MTIETIIPLADGTYLAEPDGYGGIQLKTTIHRSNGYWACDDTGVTIEGHLTAKGIVDALSLMDIKAYENVGVWTDEGITYIDRSYHFHSLNTAIDFGNLYNQKAIWDIAKGETIRL
jgi:hypothetical protein